MLIKNNPSDPVEALQKERNRPFTIEEIRYYQKEVGRVENLMRMRNAPLDEIAAFKKLFLPGADKILKKGGRKL